LENDPGATTSSPPNVCPTISNLMGRNMGYLGQKDKRMRKLPGTQGRVSPVGVFENNVDCNRLGAEL